MKHLWLLLLLCVGPSLAARAQNEESCGPKSGLCWPKLGRGSSGARVKSLQFLLRDKGYSLAPDGLYGYGTESAVRRFQSKNHLQIDGRAGWQSWEALTPTLRRGARGSGVATLQRLLQSKKYPVKSDGVYGFQTESAVRDWQKRIALTPVNGVANDTVWCYLLGGHLDGE